MKVSMEKRKYGLTTFFSLCDTVCLLFRPRVWQRYFCNLLVLSVISRDTFSYMCLVSIKWEIQVTQGHFEVSLIFPSETSEMYYFNSLQSKATLHTTSTSHSPYSFFSCQPCLKCTTWFAVYEFTTISVTKIS